VKHFGEKAIKAKILFSLVLLAGFRSYGSQNSIDSLLNIKYSTESLIDDLSFINKNIDPKKYGNSAFHFISKKEWDLKYKNEIAYLKSSDSLTLGKFYLRLCPLLNLLRDDHLELFYPEISKISSSGIRPDHVVLPLRIVSINDSAYVSCSDLLPVKTALLSMNNIPVKTIIDSMSYYISYPYQKYYREHKFIILDFKVYFMLFYQLFHIRDSVEIEYLPENSDRPETKFFKLNTINQPGAWTYCPVIMKNISLKFEDNVAILNLNTFRKTKFDSLVAEYNKLFREIKDKKADKLIIDLRFNAGGSDISWILLLPYLTSSRLKFNCNREWLDISTVIKSMNIDVSEINIESQFKGKLYLLIGYKTFSSAVRFSDFIKYNQLADSIFGIETSGQATHYGESKSYFLPGTQLRFIVSGKLFLSIDCKGDTSGVMPDVYLKQNSGREYLDNILLSKDIAKIIDMINK
jgi:peptidase S41-like protein